jgi:hypothetical protein
MALDEDDDQARSLQQPPAARALRLRAASSVAAAGAGDVIVLDRQGHVLGPGQVAFAHARAWGVLGLMVGGVGLFYGALFSSTAGVMAAAGATLLVGIQLRHWPRYRAAVVMAATYRWEEAHAAMLVLSKMRLPVYWKKSLHVGLAGLDCLLGHPELALERMDGLLPGMRATSGYPRLLRWRAEMIRAIALARVGRLIEARRQRDAVATAMQQWETSRGRGRAEYLDLVLQGVDLTLAFETDTADGLPDDETLHAWARAALLRTRFGSMLFYLAWAFHRRGDDDMARHLLAEAPARTPRSSLEAEAPRLHAWVKERSAAWDL